MENKKVKIEFQIDEWKPNSTIFPFETYKEFKKLESAHDKIIDEEEEMLFALDTKFIRLVKENVYKNVPVGQLVKFPDSKQGIFLGVSALGKKDDVTFPEDEQTNPSIPKLDDEPWPALVFKDNDSQIVLIWREEEDLKKVEIKV